MDWSSSKPAGCEACTLRGQPGPVFGDGDRSTALIIYIAQNPGQDEVRASPMKPLIGPSGNVFNRQLFESGIRRDELYITNQVKCLTPDNRSPTQHEVNCCKRILDKELEACKADTVVLAGALSFKENIGSFSTISPGYRPSDNIMLRMGCVEQRHGKKWIGTIHPAFIMRMPEWKEAALDHLKKARSIAGIKIPLPHVITHPDMDDINRHKAAARANREYADDIEALNQPGETEVDYIGGDWKMDMVGFSAIPYEAIVLGADQAHLWSDIWADPEIVQYEHNGESDRYHLEQVSPQENKRFDTMHALHYLRSYLAGEQKDKATPGKKGVRRGPGLALKPSTVSISTNLPYFNRDLEHVSRRLYNGMDNIGTLLAGRELWRQLKKWDLEEVFFSMGMKMPHILEMWRRKGANVDIRRAYFYRKFMEKRIATAELMISKLIGPMFNPGSHVQVKDLLYKIWRLPEQYNLKREGRDVTKVLTVDNEARKRLRKWITEQNAPYYKYVNDLANTSGEVLIAVEERHKAARIFLDLQDYLEGEQTKLTFLDRISPDGRIHAYFKSHGTSSFRLSSKPNLQNWPVYDLSQWGGARRDVVSEGALVPTGEIVQGAMGSLRSIIIPDNPETDSLLTIDFEQIELWAYAQQTKCKWLLDIYHKGEYIYGTVYEKFYKLPFFQEGKPRTKKFKLPSVSEKFLRRAKAIPLGFLYGRSAAAVAEEHGWTTAETEGYRREWFQLCPELEQSYSRDRFTMEQKGWIRYPFGHVIHYPSRKPSDVYAMRGQNPAAGMLLSSIIKIEQAFAQHRYQNTRIVLSVHDSITCNIPDNHIIQVYEETIEPILSRPVPELDGFVFRQSCEVGKRWDWDVLDYREWKADYLQKLEVTGAKL